MYLSLVNSLVFFLLDQPTKKTRAAFVVWAKVHDSKYSDDKYTDSDFQNALSDAEMKIKNDTALAQEQEKRLAQAQDKKLSVKKPAKEKAKKAPEIKSQPKNDLR